ncbi:MAG TPA: hypothetical protein VK870_15305 [Ignavibacteriaceae bacterium]|nr:hypothetical protein [Ignavibacteriaceae bacterium]
MKNKYFIIVIFLAALIIPAGYTLYFFPLAFLYLLYLDSKLFRFLKRISFIVLILLLLILQPLLIGEKDFSIIGIGFSSTAFYNGLMMILRAVLMISSISYLSKTADRKKIQRIFSRIGISHFDEILDHSQKLFPLLKEKSREFISATDKKRILNPLDLTAHFFAFLIKTTHTHLPKAKQENTL